MSGEAPPIRKGSTLPEDRILGGVGSRLMFENDRVRVWQLRLAPGEDSAVHRHDLDHVLIQVSGDRVAVIPEPDSEGPYRDYLEADVIPGAVVQVPRGGIETARNVGRQPYLEVIVELKD
jgi:auxin binding protein